MSKRLRFASGPCCGHLFFVHVIMARSPKTVFSDIRRWWRGARSDICITVEVIQGPRWVRASQYLPRMRRSASCRYNVEHNSCISAPYTRRICVKVAQDVVDAVLVDGTELKRAIDILYQRLHDYWQVSGNGVPHTDRCAAGKQASRSECLCWKNEQWKSVNVCEPNERERSKRWVRGEGIPDGEVFGRHPVHSGLFTYSCQKNDDPLEHSAVYSGH